MCGIVAVMGSADASQEVVEALLVLQHRGQDAAGILTHELSTKRFHLHRDQGLVSKALPEDIVSRFHGDVAIGHNRYATVAVKNDRSSRDLQPQFVNYPDGIGMAHNGNLPDAARLKEKLSVEYRRIVLSENDVEVLLNLVAQGISDNHHPDSFTRLSRAVKLAMQEAEGGYAVVGIWGGQGLFAFRDPSGLRPLILGKKQTPDGVSWMVASESSALLFTGYTPIRDITPGELIFINQSRELQSVQITQKKNSHCFFEWIYFSSPESTLAGLGVHEARLNLGTRLGLQTRALLQSGELEADVVVPVPDTSRPAAIALAESLGLPYRELLIKNRYVQRSFILPTQKARQAAVYQKLTPVREGLQGKRVLLVDDSIVRGTTSRRIISMLKDAGAKSVSLASTSPEIKNPCYFGIDFPQSSELASAKFNAKELATELNAAMIIFQKHDDLQKALQDLPLCTGCLDGKYPMDMDAIAGRFISEREKNHEVQA